MVDFNEAIEASFAYKTILNDKGVSRLSHTYLLVCEDELYSKEFAKKVSEIILDATNNSKTSFKIQKEIHSDVIMLGVNHKIMTEDVSKIASDVYVMPYEGNSKVYFLANMQDTSDEVQNKLLKTLEEPPASAYFILATTATRKLLSTVLSRSKVVELDKITDNMLDKMLAAEGIEKTQRDICVACGDGQYSKAYKMASDKQFLDMYSNIFKCLYNMNSSRDVLPFSSIFSAKTVNKEEFAELFMLIVRDLYLCKTGNEQLISNKHKKDEIKLISQGFSLTALTKIIEYCLQLKQDLVYNTNISMAIDELLLKVVEVKVRCKN